MITKNGSAYRVEHPYINNIYLEKHDDIVNADDVLIVETGFDISENGYDSKDLRLIELLEDLHQLQMIAEHQVGRFDRIDIRVN